jgi:hypothetical protein
MGRILAMAFGRPFVWYPRRTGNREMTAAKTLVSESFSFRGRGFVHGTSLYYILPSSSKLYHCNTFPKEASKVTRPGISRGLKYPAGMPSRYRRERAPSGRLSLARSQDQTRAPKGSPPRLRQVFAMIPQPRSTSHLIGQDMEDHLLDPNFLPSAHPACFALSYSADSDISASFMSNKVMVPK